MGFRERDKTVLTFNIDDPLDIVAKHASVQHPFAVAEHGVFDGARAEGQTTDLAAFSCGLHVF